MNLFRLTSIIFILLVLVYGASGQNVPNNVPNNATDVPITDDKICISQQAANKCAENARLITAYEAKIKALEDKVKAQDVTIEELKETNRKNVADLTDRLHKTELALATKTGEIIGCQAQNVEQRAIIQALLPMVKKKRNALITIF